MKRAFGLVLTLLVCGAGLVGAQEVEMPLDRYLELYDRAHPEAGPEVAPEVPWTLDEARLEVVIGARSARVVQLLTLTLLDDAWHEAPLPAAGTIVEASLGTLEGRVVSSSGERLVVRGAGRHTVRLESLAGLVEDEEAARPTWRVAVGLPAAAVVAGVVRHGASLAGGETIEEVAVRGGGLERGTDERGGLLVVGTPGATLQLEVLGKAQALSREELPLVFMARSASLVTLDRARTELRCWLEVRVAQGVMEELRVPLPGVSGGLPAMDLVEVKATGLAGWDVEGEDLVVVPLAPIEDRWAVELRLSGGPAGAVASPVLAPRGALRTLAAAAAETSEDALLELAEVGSGRRPDARETGEVPQGFRSAAKRWVVVADPARPPRWAVTFSDSAEVLAAQVDELLVDVRAGGSGRALYQVWLKVRSTGAVRLGLGVPEGFELLRAGRDGLHLAPGERGLGLELPLVATEKPQVIYVAGLIPLELPAGEAMLSIPIPSLSAPVTRVAAQVVLPGGLRCELRDQDRAGTPGEPPGWSRTRKRGDRLAELLSTGPVEEQVSDDLAELPVPRGFQRVTASWSALSATPEPLVVHVEADEQKVGWF